MVFQLSVKLAGIIGVFFFFDRLSIYEHFRTILNCILWSLNDNFCNNKHLTISKRTYAVATKQGSNYLSDILSFAIVWAALNRNVSIFFLQEKKNNRKSIPVDLDVP